MPNPPIALQLYSVRDQTVNDFAGVLRAVARMGYAGVELAGYGSLGIERLHNLLSELKLKVAGSHISIDRLEKNLDGEIADNLKLGNPYIVCPFMPAERRADAKGWSQVAASLNRIGAACRQAGLIFCYHNHAFEFEQFDGRSGYEILTAETDPQNVKLEIDVYWVKYAGGDPAALIRRYAGRFPLIHLKDMTPEPHTFAEVGEGIVDFQSIFTAAESQGAEWYIVEQDRCQRPSLESVEISLKNLRKWGKAA